MRPNKSRYMFLLCTIIAFFKVPVILFFPLYRYPKAKSDEKKDVLLSALHLKSQSAYQIALASNFVTYYRYKKPFLFYSFYIGNKIPCFYPVFCWIFPFISETSIKFEKVSFPFISEISDFIYRDFFLLFRKQTVHKIKL